MKERILNGWTVTRVFYVGLGTVVFIISLINQEWFGALIGSYFASMGVFAFGCAAGNCFNGNCNVEPTRNSRVEKQDTGFEEVKQK